MSEFDEIKELLQEIRDLQKAHFERYKEFTDAALARQHASSEATAQARSEQKRYHDYMRRATADSLARIKSATVIRLGLFVLALLLFGAPVAIFLLRLAMP
jgi:hypothetical protein